CKTSPSACSAFPCGEAKPRARASASSNQSSAMPSTSTLVAGMWGRARSSRIWDCTERRGAGPGGAGGAFTSTQCLTNCSCVSPALRVSSERLFTTAVGSDLLEREALDAVRVLALDPDEPGGPFAPRRVHVALVVDLRHAGLERIAPGAADLAGHGRGGGLEHLPVAHHGGAVGLAVDGPGRAVVVRIALLGACVDVGEDAEAELRVFVEDLALGRPVAEMGVREGLVLEDVLDEGAYLLPPLRARIGFQYAAAGGGELLEGLSHGVILLGRTLACRAASVQDQRREDVTDHGTAADGQDGHGGERARLRGLGDGLSARERAHGGAAPRECARRGTQRDRHRRVLRGQRGADRESAG